MARFGLVSVLSLALPGVAHAQSLPEQPPRGITVVGVATVKTAPDMATISIEIRGEGATADAASSDLATRQRKIGGALATLDPRLRLNTGSVATNEIRKGDCAALPGDMDILLASIETGRDQDTGPCRVTGYIASIAATAEFSSVEDAGTAVGLAQREGAASARLAAFRLRDPDAAKRAATAAAMADARAQAQALATGAGVRLGPLVSALSAPDPMDRFGFRAAMQVSQEVIAPMQIAPPVVIAVSPEEVETSARIVVVYSLAN